ncbi:ribosomal large subunit pseudouridine synthase A [Photobacterium aphoticum]|uniref:Ribosomal large subunit pseudouridine synthase A n=1 Tax=Photobacterium aphoticum TaxID=754436 RepID=A0A090R994_9GAMM|nr:ribosomal large subunit pseudouridine synthase A [Photobacterium aphoticum]
MHSPEHCFTPFKANIDAFALPERFNFPFYYEPHPLCLLAAEELQQHLLTQTDWQHNFGLDADQGEDSANAIGKMFGVLLVRSQKVRSATCQPSLAKWPIKTCCLALCRRYLTC